MYFNGYRDIHNYTTSRTLYKNRLLPKFNILHLFVIVKTIIILELINIIIFELSICICTPLQPSYNMSSRPNPLTPSPSNLSRTPTSTHTHYQHISPHRHLPHCIQAGSGSPTAQKTYIKHFSFRKLQTYLSPSIHCQNTRTSCL